MSDGYRVVPVPVSAATWDRLLASSPAVPGLRGEELVALAVGRYVEEASRSGVLHPPPLVEQGHRAVVGARLRLLREAAGWRMSEAAVAMGVSRGMVSHMELGRCAAPADRVRRLLGAVTRVIGAEAVASIWPHSTAGDGEP